LRKLTAALTAKSADPVPVVVTFDRGDDQRITLVTLGSPENEPGAIDVRKAWLPVSLQVLTPDLAGALGIAGTTGVRITRVFAKTAAGQTDLRVGDIITRLDGQPIETSAPEDVDVLPALIRRYKIGATVKLTIRRGAATLVREVKLAEAPQSPREFASYRDSDFEFGVRDIGFMDRATQHWPADRKGVLVDAVDQGSWAAVGQLAVGDLVVELDGSTIDSAGEFGKRMKRIAETRAPAVVLKVVRGIHTLFVELQPDWDGKK
jgi:serine protease Do